MSLPEPELKKVKLTDLSPNDYNPQEMPKDKYTGLVAHMRSVGFTDPLKVRPREENDPEIIKSPYVLVDGEHRLRAYMEVFPEETEILCAIMKGPEGQYLTRQQAIVSTIAYNFQHGEENPIKMAQALRIALDGGMLIEDIEDLTGMKRNRIEAFMEFEKLPESSLPPFEPDNSGSDLKPKDDPIIMAFAVYPDDRAVIERAIASQKNHLPPDTAIEEEKGRCLLIICQKVLGEFKDVGTQNGTKDENHSEA